MLKDMGPSQQTRESVAPTPMTQTPVADDVPMEDDILATEPEKLDSYDTKTKKKGLKEK